VAVLFGRDSQQSRLDLEADAQTNVKLPVGSVSGRFVVGWGFRDARADGGMEVGLVKVGRGVQGNFQQSLGLGCPSACLLGGFQAGGPPVVPPAVGPRNAAVNAGQY
jgi:hypothetical protein